MDLKKFEEKVLKNRNRVTVLVGQGWSSVCLYYKEHYEDQASKDPESSFVFIEKGSSKEVQDYLNLKSGTGLVYFENGLEVARKEDLFKTFTKEGRL